MSLQEIHSRRQKRLAQAKEGIGEYIDALEDYELNLLSWIESASSSNDYEGWVLYQFSRAVSCFRSCINLISSGCATDALGLSRTLLDINILVQWVAIEPAVRLKTATVDEVMKQRAYDAKRQLESMSDDLLSEDNRSLLEELASTAPHRMPGLPSTAKMAKEIGGSQLYGTMFGLSSAFLHNQGSELQYLAMSRGTATIEADPYPSKENIELAWLFAYFSMKVLWLNISQVINRPINYSYDIQNKIAQQLMQRINA